MGPETMQSTCIQDIKQSDHSTENSTSDVQRLTDALAKVASLVVDNSIYLPIFERIEFELAALDAQSSAVSRARVIAARHQMALA